MSVPTGCSPPGQSDYVPNNEVVSPGAVRACAVIVPVADIVVAAVRARRRRVLAHAAHDPTAARTILTEAFESGLPS